MILYYVFYSLNKLIFSKYLSCYVGIIEKFCVVIVINIDTFNQFN